MTQESSPSRNCAERLMTEAANFLYMAWGFVPADTRAECKRLEDALRDFTPSETERSGQHFIAPRPLPIDLAAVLVQYDEITNKADRGDPEWDFVMTAADYRVIRDFFSKLKPGGAPTVITNPPKGWTP